MNPNPPLTVHPRTPATPEHRQIFAVDLMRRLYTDENGGVGTLDELLVYLAQTPPSIVVCQCTAEFLALMDERWSFDPRWQFSITPLQRQLYRPNGKPSTMKKVSTVVNFFGWRATRSPRHEKLYHLAIDPVSFTGTGINSSRPAMPQLMEWARQVRDFCVEQELTIRPTQGAIARQFLRDPRFYPVSRRKVPKATNAVAREALPGNYYEVRARDNPDKEYNGVYLDQTRSHHYHARHTQFPHADHLTCHGRFHGREGTWLTGARAQSAARDLHGLFYGYLEPIGNSDPQDFMPEYLRRARTKFNQPVYWWSTERDLIASLGFRVEGLIAAYGCTETDTGLGRFAQWAETEQIERPYDWKKPLLLSTYGTLASSPRQLTVAYAKAKRGELQEFPAGQLKLTATARTAANSNEPSSANVIHRGLIEAATRTESIMFANYLRGEGFNVLCIYADAVIVEAGPALPLTPEPWRVQKELHHLRFLSSNAFVSGEMERLPGISRERRLKASLGTVGHALGARQRIRSEAAR